MLISLKTNKWHSSYKLVLIFIAVKIVENKIIENGKVEEQENDNDVIAANRAKLAQKLASKGKKDVKYVGNFINLT